MIFLYVLTMLMLLCTLELSFRVGFCLQLQNSRSSDFAAGAMLALMPPFYFQSFAWILPQVLTELNVGFVRAIATAEISCWNPFVQWGIIIFVILWIFFHFWFSVSSLFSWKSVFFFICAIVIKPSTLQHLKLILTLHKP